jgi:hypothetical protein
MRAPKKDEATVAFESKNSARIDALRKMQYAAECKGEMVEEYNALAEQLLRDMIAAGANPMRGLSYVKDGQLVFETATHKSARAIYAESH